MAKKKETEDMTKKDIPVEEAFARLEEIIHCLENEETGLSDSMKYYTEGVGLLQQVKSTLEGVEKELQILMPKDN